MRNMDLTTPAVLFPAISLLLLAYTNRFLALAALVRSLHERYGQTREDVFVGHIENLRKRVMLIRNMQACGAASMLCCGLCMVLILGDAASAARAVFALSLALFIGSL